MNEFDFRWVLMVLCMLVFALSFAKLLWAAWRHQNRGEFAQGSLYGFRAIELV